jgi:hypothetical protein
MSTKGLAARLGRLESSRFTTLGAVERLYLDIYNNLPEGLERRRLMERCNKLANARGWDLVGAFAD